MQRKRTREDATTSALLSSDDEENKVFQLTLDNNDDIASESIERFFVNGVNAKGQPTLEICESAAKIYEHTADSYKQTQPRICSRALINLGWLYDQKLIGNNLNDEDRYTKAAHHYQLAAGLGNPLALLLLGELIRNCKLRSELSPEERSNEAIKLTKQAAKLGYVHAMYFLACYYEQPGKELTNLEQINNRKKAIKYYAQAANLNHTKSIVRMAMFSVQSSKKIRQLNIIKKS